MPKTPSPASPTESPTESPAGFEAAMDTLEDLVARMEAGDLPLEESLQEYQRGVELIRACQSALDEAQQRIERLVEASAPPEGREGPEKPETTDDDVPF